MSRVLLLILLAGCQSLDGFLYDPLEADGHDLSTAVIPSHEDLTIRTPDGETLHAVFVPSSGRRPEVTLIYLHGQSHHIGKSWPRIEYLYPLGYNIVALDPRGYGKSTGTPTEKGLQIDLAATRAFLLDRPDVDAKHLVYYGRSFGGALAIELAAQAAPAALITESTFTSVAAMVKDGAYVDLPRSFVANDRWDSIGKIRDIAAPYLVLHGTADPYVQFKYAGELVAAHRGPHQLVAVSGADHGNLPEVMGQVEYRRSIASFVDAF